ncbi:hypothetical protein Angca_008285 [Angiostrongylus cantonensis]|nr:hypothetical protein Angca_008285 [Angiostrongylus cantonensis]
MESIYAQQKPTSWCSGRRPAPFPLQIPPQPPLNKPRTQVTTMSQGIYHNVPTSTTIQKPAETMNTTSVIANGNLNSPSDGAYALKRPQPLIWSVQTEPLKELITLPSVIPSSGEKRSARQKPRWGRFMQSLCCCVTPHIENDKLSAPRHPSLLITQVQKNGTNNGSSFPDCTSDDHRPTTVSAPQVLSDVTSAEKFLLPPVRASDVNKKCLIIDLDETLVHSSFKPVKNPDFVIPVEIDGVVHQVYVLKRPYVDEFLARIGDRYECVLFTASLAKYADPVADLLDKRGVFRSRLFREACVYHKGNYVKDLAKLGRDLSKVLIIDNSPASYAFHPENAIPVPTWWDDPSDVELLDILPLLERLEKADSIYEVLKHVDQQSQPFFDRTQ